MAATELPSFDLVVATIDRSAELEALLGSLDRQTQDRFRVLLVDQNNDERIAELVPRHPALKIERLRSGKGLARARNAALSQLTSEVVAFPDDDCLYPDDLLERVARRFAGDLRLDGLTGRGGASASWRRDPALLTRDNLWNRAISYTIFLRREVVERVGPFDEQLGLGSGTPWSSGEEIDYLIRAIDTGARIEYEPSLVVTHPEPSFSAPTWRAVGARDGASVGYLLRKHRYPRSRVARMLVRPAGGAMLAGLRRNGNRAAFHLATLRGRVLGYRRADPSTR
jgi:glycosyltransferase involved in cell wall biosynthesis